MEDAAPLPPILARCRPADPSRAGAARRFAGPRAGPAFAIGPERCNRCGACLRLGCPAISDEGGEALVVDVDACSGCAQCEPVCRSRAIAATR
ncbi:MAG TPA: 4Fe-4S binding protein [Anaeromyxobacter sp.]